jgi:hypothetical protein
LRAAGAEEAVVAVEQCFVRGSAADVVGVGRVAVEDDVLIRRQPVEDEALEQVSLAVVLVREVMTELPATPRMRIVRIVSTNNECGPLNE